MSGWFSAIERVIIFLCVKQNYFIQCQYRKDSKNRRHILSKLFALCACLGQSMEQANDPRKD